MILFSVVSRILIGKPYSSAEMQTVYSKAPADWVMKKYYNMNTNHKETNKSIEIIYFVESDF